MPLVAGTVQLQNSGLFRPDLLNRDPTGRGSGRGLDGSIGDCLAHCYVSHRVGRPVHILPE